nr:hypothetical protein [uncultured Draconibacterium sp.]
MKKILILLLTIIAVNASAQLTPLPDFRIQNATTEFGIPVSKYTTIYDYGTGTWYRATAAIASTATITTASASLNPMSSAEVNDLTSSVTWATVPDAYISQSSVTQHQAALNIDASQVANLDYFSGSDITGNETAFVGWDKNAADDFDGDYGSLANTPDLSQYEPVQTKGNLTEDIAGVHLSATRQVIGGPVTISLDNNYLIPTIGDEAEWEAAYGWGNWAAFMPGAVMTFTNKSGSNSQWTNDEGYITDGNTNWDNIYGFVTSVIDWTLPSQGTIDPTNYVDNNTTYTEAQLNQDDVTSSDVTTALGYTPYNATNPSGYLDAVPANSVGYAEVGTELKQSVTNNTLAWDLAGSGIIFSAVSSTGTISFTDYDIAKSTIIRLTISGGADISWPSTAKIQEGSKALGDGTFNIVVTPLSSTIFIVTISKDV